MAHLRESVRSWGVAFMLLAAVAGLVVMAGAFSSAAENGTVVQDLHQALNQLLEANGATSPAEQAATAQEVLALLDGEGGVIAQLEEATGRSAEEFSAEGAQAPVADAGEPAAVQALSHVVAARDALQGEPTEDGLINAAEHIAAALELLESA